MYYIHTSVRIPGSGRFRYRLGAIDDHVLPNGTAVKAGDVIDVPTSTSSGTFGRVTVVYGSAWDTSDQNRGIMWGQNNPDREGLYDGPVYAGHKPINMRTFDGRDAPENKQYIRPIDDGVHSWANGISKFKTMWNSPSCPKEGEALGQFDFVVKGTYNDGTGDGANFGNHVKYGPRVRWNGGERVVKAGDVFTVMAGTGEAAGHLYDRQLTYTDAPWNGDGGPPYIGMGHLKLAWQSTLPDARFDSTCWVNEPRWANGYVQNDDVADRTRHRKQSRRPSPGPH